MKRAIRVKRQPDRTSEPANSANEAGAVRAAKRVLDTAAHVGDTQTAGALLAPQFVWINETGRVRSRAEVLGAVGAVASKRAGAGVKVRDYGCVTVVTGRRRSAAGADVYFVDVWTKGRSGWRALIRHDNKLADPEAPPSVHKPQPRPADAPPPACPNPLETVPYAPKSRAERDIIAAFQALERAVTRNDSADWVKYVADEFVVTRTGQHPTTKADRAAFMDSAHQVNAETWVAEVEWMQLWVLGDAAVMRADHRMPGGRRPPYRATSIWVRREGRWRMALSQQTAIAG